jgi:hypothetical protein
MTHEAKAEKKRASAVRQCTVCGHEAWPIVFGMVLPGDRQDYAKAEFAGCCVVHEERLNPRTGQLEYGVPEWVCQNAECRHRWW